MSQETSSPDLSPSLPETLTPAQGVRLWLDQMECAEQFLIAGLSREVSSEDEVREKYREWYRQTMDEHDRTVIEMMRQFEQRQESS